MTSRAPILIVDDDYDVRDALRDVLESAGYDVALAADGHDALDWLRSHPQPGLVLLDWMMPVMNGAELCSELRREPNLAKIPVLLLTADSRTQQSADRLGVAGHLAKPVHLAELLAAVEQHLHAP